MIIKIKKGFQDFNLLVDNIKLFELKFNQNSINYKKNSLIKIFLRYYYINIRGVFNKNIKISSKNIVISHVASIKQYSYLSKYKSYIKYRNIPLKYSNLLIELIKFPLYIYQYFKIKSKWRNQIFEAYLNSKLITNYIQQYSIDKVIFFGYDYDLTFLFATLYFKNNNIRTVQYCNSGFLGNHNLEVADELYCRTKIHKHYMEKRKDIFLSQKIKYLFEYKIIDKIENKKRIAIYTSGYYARVNLNFSDKTLLKKGIEAETKIIDTIKEYALIHKNIEIVLFIHLHNNIENMKDAKKYYKDFLLLNNVRLQNENENSIENFYNYDLGICCMSEIFFDRYERGYKTILMNPFSLDDFIMNSNLKNITLNSDEINLFKKINYYLEIDNQKYFSILCDEK